MKLNRILPTLLLLACLLAIFAVKGTAQAPTPSDDDVNAIAKDLFCPVCENTPLDVCPTQACEQWRGLIRQMLAEGKSEAEIKNYFVSQYGLRVLSTPPAQGFTWLIYIIPPAAILVGGLLLFRALRSWRRPVASPEAAPPPAPPQDEYVRRLEAELRKREDLEA